MSFDVLTATPGAVDPGVVSEVRFAYPSGRTAASYETNGALLIVNGVSYAQGGAYHLVYGPQDIRVRWLSGPSVAANVPWTLRAPLKVSAEVSLGASGAPSGGLFNFRPDNLRKWRKALANVRTGTANAKLACIGDSTTAGSGAGTTSGVLGARAKAYPSALASILNGGGLPASNHSLWGAGGAGYTGNGYDGRLVLGAGWGESSSAVSPLISNNSTINALSFTPSGQVDTFDVYYVQNSGYATWTANVDGGATLATVNAANATPTVAKQTITTTLGTHTLNLARSSGGSFTIVGIDAYDSTTKRVQVQTMGWVGSKINNWAITTNPWNAANMITFLAPDLTLVNIGINDWNGTTTVGSFKSDYQIVIDKAKASGDVILCVPVPTSLSTTALAKQQAIIQAISDLATANDVPLIDLTARFGSYEDMSALSLYYDTVHPNAVGYADVAHIIARALMI